MFRTGVWTNFTLDDSLKTITLREPETGPYLGTLGYEVGVKYLLIRFNQSASTNGYQLDNIDYRLPAHVRRPVVNLLEGPAHECGTL